MLKPPLCGAAALVLLLPNAPAQDPPAPTAAPAAGAATPLFELELAGPAVWRAQFAPTNLGSLLSSDSGRELWQPLTGRLELVLRAAFAGDDDAWRAARARALDYAGALELRIFYDGSTASPQIELRLRPDGHTDLAALARDVAAVARRPDGADWIAADDDLPRRLPLQGGALLSEPCALGAGMLAVVADEADLPAALARARSAEPPTGNPDPDPRKQPAMAARFDAAAATALFLARSDSAPAWRAAGLDALGTSTFELGTAGPHVRIDLEQQFTRDERGLFAVLFPASQGVPAIASLLPNPDFGWKAGRLDLAALVRPILAIAAARGQDREETERELRESLGGDEHTGLLSHFTDEYLLFGRLDAAFDTDGNQITWGIAFRVRDSEALLAKMTAGRKGIGMTELSDDDLGGGYRVRRYGGWFQTTAVSGPDLFAVIYGYEAETRAEELVAAARRGNWTARTEPPQRARGVLPYAPPGLNGIAEGNVAAIVLQLGVAIGLLGELAGDFELPSLQGDDALPTDLLREHGLATTWTMTGYADQRWHFRALW
ncbi:MAG: hypothetical protein AB7O97_08185 [Planctomycetota bacterium]